VNVRAALDRLTAEHDASIRNVQAPPGSTNAELLALPQQRVWTADMRGGVYLLPRTGIIVAPHRFEKGGAGAMVIVGNEHYPRGGHDLWISDLELQTAIEVEVRA
jgi:hypothetical protein